MSATCQRFEELVLDLVYDELDAEKADQLRAHATSCRQCREVLAEIELTRQLAANLPLLEPTENVDRAILQAASRAVSETAGTAGAEPVATPSPAVVSQHGDPSLWRWLRGLILTPAVATCAAATVVFVISFFLYKHSAPTPVSSESSAPFYGPAFPRQAAPAPQPAETKDKMEKEAIETAPLRPLVAEPSLDRTPSSAAGEPEKRARVKSRSARSSRPKPKKIRQSEPGVTVDHLASRAGSGPGALEKPNPARPEPKMDFAPPPADPQPKTAPAEKRKSSSSRKPVAAPAQKAPAERESLAGIDDLLGAAAGAEPNAPVASEPLRTTDGDESTTADRLNCQNPHERLLPLINTKTVAATRRSAALHQLARCEKQSGRWSAALKWYNKLLATYPQYGRRPAALFEAAGCYRRLGQLNRARNLLNDLKQIPGWSAKASRALEDLEK